MNNDLFLDKLADALDGMDVSEWETSEDGDESGISDLDVSHEEHSSKERDEDPDA